MSPRTVRRALTLVAAAGALLASSAAPAHAHASFAEAAVPAGSDQRLTMYVPEERGDTVHNVGVDARVPNGWTALGCEAAAPWSCQLAAGGVIKWTKAPGAAPTAADTVFVFTARTGAPGTVAIPVVQTYDSGEVVRWIGPADSEEPAAFIQVVAPGAEPTTTTAPPTTTTAPPSETTAPPSTVASTTTTARVTGTPAAPAATTTTAAAAAPTDTTVAETTTVPPESTTTTTAPATTTTALGELAAARTEEDSGGSAAVAVLLVLLFVVAAGGAVGWNIRRRRTPGDGEA